MRGWLGWVMGVVHYRGIERDRMGATLGLAEREWNGINGKT